MISETAPRTKRFLSLRIKIWFVFILIFTPVFIASYIWFYLYTSDRVLNSISEDLIDTIQGAVMGMNVDGFVTLYEEEHANNPKCPPGPEDENGYYPENPLYWEHVTWLSRIGDLEPQARLYTYIKGEQPDEIIAIGSSGALWDPPAGFMFCQRYSSGGATQIYDGLTARVDVWKPYKDAYGEWITTYMPIEKDGKIVGAIGVDILASYVREVQGGIVRNGLFAFVVSYILIF